MTAPAAGALPAARVVHRSPGRVRLRIPEAKGDAARMEALAQAVSGVEGVTRVEARAGTGSLLLKGEGDPDRIVSGAVATGALRLAEPGEVVEPQPDEGTTQHLLDGILDVLDDLNGQFREETQGRMDLSAAAFVGVMGAAVVQLLRGDILPPAVTLLGHGAAILETRRLRRAGVDQAPT